MTETQRALFFDIDGTLLPRGAFGLPDETLTAIHAAQARGHLCFICTGRCWALVDPYLREAGFDGIISGAGTLGIFRGERIWDYPIDPAETRRVIALSRACRVRITYEGYEAVAYDDTCFTEESRAMYAHHRSRGRNVLLLGEDDNFPFIKINIDKTMGGDLDRFCAQMAQYHIVPYTERWDEALPPDCDKGSAILRMLTHLGMTPAQAIAVGDSHNDIPMFRVCGTSVAMGDSLAARSYPVTYVTGTCEAGGIPQMLRHFGLTD